ncbi:MAG TPA: hypothetical protein VMM36_16610 [Opitutaceae bacterium]|nr:hypothetical protein [Opitutaceae bacterium]
MKSLLLMIAVVALACASSFLVFYKIADRPDVRRAATEGNSMEWLRAEFRLGDSQFEAIKKAHRDFSVVCAGHCRDIMEARSTAGAEAEVARLEAVCVEAMVAHFRAVAAMMPPGEGDRYLAVVLPRIEGYDHTRSPTIGVRH